MVKKRLADWMSGGSWPISVVLLLDGTWDVPDMLLHSPACCRTRWVPTSLISARDRHSNHWSRRLGMDRENATGANVQATNIGHLGQEQEQQDLLTAGPASFCILQLLVLFLPSPLCREIKGELQKAKGKNL